MIMPGKRD